MSGVQEVWRELVLLVRRVKDVNAGAVRAVAAGVEPMTYVALARLEELGPTRPSALAEHLRLDLSTVSRQLAALERCGYVDRVRDPADSRAQIAAVTATGAGVVERVREAQLAVLRERLSTWTSDDLGALSALLHRMADDLDRQVDTDEPATPAIAGQPPVKGST